jgi:hypothetical protein
MTDPLRTFVLAMTTWLDQAGVPYMLAGSFASTLHGRPRSTQDVDIVIDPTESTLQAFLDELPADRAYVDRRTALRALASRDMFNVIDLETGWKADLIIRKARSFSVREFERRRAEQWSGLSIIVRHTGRHGAEQARVVPALRGFGTTARGCRGCGRLLRRGARPTLHRAVAG